MISLSEEEAGRFEAALGAMTEQVRSFNGPLAPSVDQGYTYFGQMITHEIARPSRPGQLSNRSQFGVMNLESLYGPVAGCTRMYTHTGMFVLSDSQIPVDLPRVTASGASFGEALIPEPRNDENLIVAQLHLLFLKLHNWLITQGYAENAAGARRLVIRLFQLLVIEDFLYQILSPVVFEAVFRRSEKQLIDTRQADLDEAFSSAAFRFGHSMVRGDYILRRDPIHGVAPVALLDLFKRGQPLQAHQEIDWALFFGWPALADVDTTNASTVDVRLEKQMTQLPVQPAEEPNIIVSDLNAGMRVRPALGVAYLNARVSASVQRQIDCVAIPDDVLPTSFSRRDLSVRDLPLWVYLLVEASYHASNLSRGKVLGPLGSLIVAEQLRRSIERSNHPAIDPCRGYDFDRAFSELGAFGVALQGVRDVDNTNGEQRLSMRQVLALAGVTDNAA